MACAVRFILWPLRGRNAVAIPIQVIELWLSHGL